MLSVSRACQCLTIMSASGGSRHRRAALDAMVCSTPHSSHPSPIPPRFSCCISCLPAAACIALGSGHSKREQQEPDAGPSALHGPSLDADGCRLRRMHAAPLLHQRLDRAHNVPAVLLPVRVLGGHQRQDAGVGVIPRACHRRNVLQRRICAGVRQAAGARCVRKPPAAGHRSPPAPACHPHAMRCPPQPARQPAPSSHAPVSLHCACRSRRCTRHLALALSGWLSFTPTTITSRSSHCRIFSAPAAAGGGVWQRHVAVVAAAVVPTFQQPSSNFLCTFKASLLSTSPAHRTLKRRLRFPFVQAQHLHHLLRAHAGVGCPHRPQ